MMHEGNQYWWRHGDRPDRSVLANQISSYASWLQDRHHTQLWRERVFEGIYQDRMISSGSNSAALSLLRTSGFTAARLNIVRSIIDTLVSKIGSRRFGIKANPSDMDYSYKARAKGLSRFIRGKMEEMEMNALSPLICRDSYIHGTGSIKIFSQFGEMMAERVLREELFVDPREALRAKPRQLFQRKAMSREVLAEMFPKHKAQIRDASPPEDSYGIEYEDYGGSDMVEVWEAWHLPSSPDAKDGRHAICIDKAVLAWEPWTRPRFPFAFLHYSEPIRGFWGRGLVEDLAPIQMKINETVRDIQDALYFGAQLKVFLRRGSNVAKQHLGRTQRSVAIDYDGATPPQYVAPNPVSKDQLNFLQMMIDMAYELSGISKMSAQAKNPIGSGASAVALQEFYDIESERYRDVEQRKARWNVEVGEIMIDEAKAMAEAGTTGIRAAWHQRTVMQSIEWDKVDMSRDQYRLTLEETNFLPDTRAGKLEATEQLAKLGVMSGPEVSVALTGFPDLDRLNKRLVADYELCEYIMEKLKDPDVPLEELAPDSYVNLQLAEQLARAEYGIAFVQQAPEEVLSRFRSYISMVVHTAGKIPPDPPPEMAGAMPPGMPPEVAGAMPPAPTNTGGPLPPGAAPESLPGQALPGL